MDKFKGNENVGVAHVTYGSRVFDGAPEGHDWISPLSGFYGYNTVYSVTSNLGNVRTEDLTEEEFQYTDDGKESIKIKVPDTVPVQRPNPLDPENERDDNQGIGGTFTQQGLEKAGYIMDNSTAKNKFIVLLTDGMPTFGYKGNSAVRGNYIKNYENYPYFNYNYKITGFDRDNIIGIGNKYHLGSEDTTNVKSGTVILNEGYPFKETSGEIKNTIRGYSYLNHQGLGGVYPIVPDNGTWDYYYLDKIYRIRRGQRTFTVKDLGIGAMSEAINIRQRTGADIYTIGVGIRTGVVSGDDYWYDPGNYVYIPNLDSIDEREAINMMKNICGDPTHYYDAKYSDQIAKAFNDIAKRIKYSIPDGRVEDKLGENFNLLLNGENLQVHYPWTDHNGEECQCDIFVTMDPATQQKQEEIIANIAANNNPLQEKPMELYFNEDNQIVLENILLEGGDKWVNVKYNVQIKTEAEGFNPQKLYQTNGLTTLVPDYERGKDRILDFYVPSARSQDTKINIQKLWYMDNIPDGWSCSRARLQR